MMHAIKEFSMKAYGAYRVNMGDTVNAEVITPTDIKPITQSDIDRAIELIDSMTASVDKAADAMKQLKGVSMVHDIDMTDRRYDMDTPQDKIKHVTESLCEFLTEKNARYGNSALEPVDVFNKHGQARDVQSITIRMDDKISRIINSTTLRENDIVDLMGYMVLLCIKNGWTDFNKMLD